MSINKGPSSSSTDPNELVIDFWERPDETATKETLVRLGFLYAVPVDLTDPFKSSLFKRVVVIVLHANSSATQAGKGSI
jgi:hypothetical protein